LGPPLPMLRSVSKGKLAQVGEGRSLFAESKNLSTSFPDPSNSTTVVSWPLSADEGANLM
jgi:hypothetical protein